MKIPRKELNKGEQRCGIECSPIEAGYPTLSASNYITHVVVLYIVSTF